MRHTSLLVVIAAGAAATVAQAGPVFFSFQNETLRRFTIGGSMDEFTLSARLMGSSLSPDGTIRGTSAIRFAGAFPAYALDDAMGTPMLSEISDTNPEPYSFITYVGNTAYSTNSAGELLIMDSNTLALQSVVGNMGLGPGNVGAGYDASTDTFYMINKETNSLYTVDYNTATPTLVGNLGFDWFNGGAEFYNGTLYASIQDPSRGELLLGEINTETGEFTLLRSIATYDPNGDPMQVSLSVIPAPAGLSLLAAGGLVAFRRQR